MFTHLYRQSISCILSTVLLSNMLYGADLAVDTAAAAQHQAGLDVTANGIPLVNIVAPNATGMSHNKFTDFNVNPVGLILNNGTAASLTQLAGMVQGNANLGTTPARVILNEVTGTSRTLLRGFTEVAGHSADVIIANPNGITVNGGGFINTPRATLSTGIPNYSGGVYQGFNVRGGDVLIEGDGMVADNIDRVDFYTKTLQLNAQIHAKRLDVITGDNDIAADGSTYTPQNGTGTQTYSIDSSVLGGINANAITLIATDTGVGVNLPEITYASDSLTLNANGEIVLGAAVSDNTLNSTSQSLTVNGLLRSGTTMDLKATDTLTVSSNGVILSGGDIAIHDTGTLRNDAGRIEAANDLSIQASAIENFSSMTPTTCSEFSSKNVFIQLSSHWRENTRMTVTETQTIDKADYRPAYMLAGRDMILDGAIHNRYSLIAADRDMYLSGSLNNEATVNAYIIMNSTSYIEEYQHHSDFWSSWEGWYYSYTGYGHTDYSHGNLAPQ
jgi:filamentous hemagglutinin